MISKCFLVFALTVFGASAGPRSYPVRLNNYGPSATTIPIRNSHVQTPVVERVPLRNAGCIPKPRTISNVCTCYKQILKPLVHNQIISVPSVQRLIQTTATPVIEKIHYTATPVEPGPFPFPTTLVSGATLTPVGPISNGIVATRCPTLVSLPSVPCAPNVVLV